MLAYHRSAPLGLLWTWVSFTVACDTAEAPGRATTRLACDAFAQTGSVPVTFAGFSAGPGPVLTTQAAPFEVALAPTVAQGQYSGHAQWQVEMSGLYGIYVDQAVTLLLRDGEASVNFKRLLGSPLSCDRIGRYAFVSLSPGTYSLEIGPAPVTSVRLQLVTAVAGDEI
jgi:hypothetical protein